VPLRQRRRKNRKRKRKRRIIHKTPNPNKLMDIWRNMIFPVRRVWLALSARLKTRKNGSSSFPLLHHHTSNFLFLGFYLISIHPPTHDTSRQNHANFHFILFMIIPFYITCNLFLFYNSLHLLTRAVCSSS